MPVRSSTSSFRWLLRGLVFVLLLSLCVHFIGKRYEQAAAHNTINAWTAQRYQDFYALPENSLDLVFLGSSHSYCTFDPANFTDFSSFQMGTPLQHPDTSYYALQDILAHQSPKTVVLEVYWDMLDDDFELKQAASFFEVLQNDDLKKEYIRQVFPLSEKVKYKIAAIRWQSDYFAWQSSLLQKDIRQEYGVTQPAAAAGNGEEYYLALGYTFCNTVIPPDELDKTNQFKGMDGKDFSIAKSQKKYLTQIAALCADRGIRLIFVTAPIAPVSLGYIQNYGAIHDQVAALAEALNVPYLDYNQVDCGLTLENFRDDAHLNDSGVKILDKHFDQWLKEIDDGQ